MQFRFNPFTGNLDEVDTTAAAGSDTQVQVNDGGKLAGFAELIWNKITKVLRIGGDIELNDGGSFTTTVQTITPTANRTISYPDATGTLALVAGSSGQFIYNNAGAYGGVSTMTFDGTSVTLAGRLINSYTSLASSPAKVFTGTWFTGGTATTTKPHFLIEPSGTTSTAWSTSGTGLGVNAASGFAGNLLDLQVNGSSRAAVTSAGQINVTGVQIGANSPITGGSNNLLAFPSSAAALDSSSGAEAFNIRERAFYGWSSSTAGASPSCDLRLFRDAANTLAQRNGGTSSVPVPQVFRVYNYWASATDHERGYLSWASNVFRIGTEKGSGGGTARDMELQTDGTTRITVKANGAILFSGLPTSDPAVAGQLWNDGNTLKISAG